MDPCWARSPSRDDGPDGKATDFSGTGIAKSRTELLLLYADSLPSLETLRPGRSAPPGRSTTQL